jgi:hypothetical protein
MNIVAINPSNSDSPFDSIRRYDEHGNEYWIARELMGLMGYRQWRNFETPINQAIENLELNDDKVSDHFLLLVTKSQGRDGKDFKLTRYACYMTALCCDGRKPEVAAAKKYFAIKTRQAETVIPAPIPERQLPPVRDGVDYANAAIAVQGLKDGILKQLISDLLVDELSLDQNLKYLPVAEKPKQYTIAKVRAKSLGYTETQIGNGTSLGRFVKSQIQPAFQEQIGRYLVYHYEINSALDTAIHTFFK